MHVRSFSSIILMVLIVSAALVARLAAMEIAPIGPGPYAVGSSNLEIVEHPTAPLIDYLKGKAGGAAPLSLADILARRDAALVTELQVPADAAVYGRRAGGKVPLALYVLYPTTRENSRADYKFPYPDTADNVFPHMQRAGEKPIIAEAGVRYPLIVFSHGFEGHGLWDLDHLKFLAAHGYIVVSVFHGDGRYPFEAGVNLRPLELKAALDCVLAHPDFGPAIASDRIGVSGGSMGGFTVLATLGGKYLKSAEPMGDPRIKAGFGLVPFMGASFGWWPFSMEVWPFGKDYAGLRSVRTPFLAVYGEKDKNVVPESVEAGTRQIGGPASAVRLGGEPHLVSKAAWPDIYTWEILFFDTWLKGDVGARKKLYGGDSVQGGVADQKTYQHLGAAVAPRN